jgi:predicted negative regulator of RcsB-dependent stress response
MRVLTVMACAVLVVALAAAWLVWQQQVLSAQTACQVQYNEAYASAQTYRAALADADRAATLTLITQVFTPPAAGQTSTQRDAAIEGAYQLYKGAEAAITAERQNNPVPAAPHC